MTQGEKKLSATQVEYTSETIISARHHPSVLRDNHHLQYYIGGDSVGEIALQLHHWKIVQV